jgi:FAD dependent oxidoreductase
MKQDLGTRLGKQMVSRFAPNEWIVCQRKGLAVADGIGHSTLDLHHVEKAIGESEYNSLRSRRSVVRRLAGFETFVGRDGSVQNPTMIFRLMGVDVDRFRAYYGDDTILGDEVSQMIRNLHNSREYDLPRAKVFLFRTPRPNELLCNCTRVIGRDGRELNPLLVEDITEAEIQDRRQVREYARFFRDRLVGCETSFVNDTGVQVGVRQTRQVRGVEMLTNDDVVSGRKRKTSIGRSAWPIELHSGEKPRIEWLLDDYYDIAYENFVPLRGEGLLVAGRCLSAEHEAMASARVTAQCFSYGQAIGMAAAMCVQGGTSPRAATSASPLASIVMWAPPRRPAFFEFGTGFLPPETDAPKGT